MEKKGAGNRKAGGPNKKGVSRSLKAGLQFPVSRTRCFLKKSSYALIYLTTMIEYFIVEVLELTRNTARDKKKTRIIPRHVLLAIWNDEELGKLLSGMTITHDGILPNINLVLLLKRTADTAGKEPKLTASKSAKKAKA